MIISGSSCFLKRLIMVFSRSLGFLLYLSISAFQKRETRFSLSTKTSSSPSRSSGAEMTTSEVTLPILSNSILYLIAAALLGATN